MASKRKTKTKKTRSKKAKTTTMARARTKGSSKKTTRVAGKRMVNATTSSGKRTPRTNAKSTSKSKTFAESSLPKIGKPAERALASVGVTRLEHVARLTERELHALHGMGPKAIGILVDALGATGKSLRKEKQGLAASPPR